MAYPVAVQLERDHALRDAQDVVLLYGEEMILRVRDESEVNRDQYSSIKSRKNPSEDLVVKVYPVTFNPNMHQIEKAGLRENVDAIAYVPMKTLSTAKIDFEQLDLIRSSVILRGNKYWIKDKVLSSQFLDTFLYVAS